MVHLYNLHVIPAIGNKKRVTGAVFLDPITGKSEKYDTKHIPSWADRIYPESLVVEELDDNGSLKKGSGTPSLDRRCHCNLRGL